MLKRNFLIVILLIISAALLSSAPVNLSKTHWRPSTYPAVATYGNNIMVVWREECSLDEGSWDIYYALYTNGSWAAAKPVFDTDNISKNAHVCAGPDGSFHCTWREYGVNANAEIFHGLYKNGSWQSMQEAYDHPGAEDNWPRVAVMANNTINLTWDYEVTGRYDKITKNTWKVAGGSWNAAGLTVSQKLPLHYVGHSDICTLGNTIYCVWREGKLYDRFDIKFAQKVGTGAWTTPVMVNSRIGAHSYPRVAVDSTGIVHVLWESGQSIHYSSRVNGVWSNQVRINNLNSKHPNFVDIDVDSAGNCHATYMVYITDADRRIYYNFKKKGQAWNPLAEVRLSVDIARNQLPAISVDNTGAAHVVWCTDADANPGDVLYVKVPSKIQILKLTSPATGQKYTTGSTVPFAWTSEGITGDVALKMRNEGTRVKYHVATVSYDSSPYNYVIPPSFPYGYYRAGVVKNTLIGSSGIFSIAGITITSNHTGKSYGVGSFIPMTWTSGGITDNITVNLIKSDNTASYPLGTVLFNNSPHNFPIAPTIPTGSYYVKMSQAPAEAGTGIFNVVTPTINVTSPSGGTYDTGDSIPISWTTSGVVGDMKLTLWKSDHTLSYPINDSVPYSASPYHYSLPCSVPGGTYYVKVEQGTISGNSTNFTVVFNNSATLTVVYPNGGEEERAGTVQTVTWTTTGSIANVMVEFSPNNGIIWEVLIDSTPNTGSYTGLLPVETPPLTTYKLRISDVNGCAGDESDGTFTVLPPLPIHIFSPAGGEVFTRGGEMPIGFTTSGISTPVKVFLAESIDNYINLGEHDPNETLFWYTIPAAVTPGSYVIVIVNGSLKVKSKRFTIN